MEIRATMTPHEVADVLGVHVNSIYRAVAAGEFAIEPIRIGRKFVFARRQVERLLGIREGE